MDSPSAPQPVQKVNLAEKFAALEELWSPRVVAELDGSHLAKVAKLEGEFVRHAHAQEDELFLVMSGRLRLELDDQVIELAPGELCVIPAGVEHRPVASEECHVLIVERASTAHTGAVKSDLTRSLEEQQRAV